jgi:hypothetical protein
MRLWPERATAFFFRIELMPIAAPRINPTTRLILWLQFLLAVQWMSGALLAGAFLLLPLLGRRVWARAGKLVWRSRWLLFSLFVIFSWGIAGHPLWDGADSAFAPTHEGIAEAATHLGRLVLVLVAVATFLEAMPLPDLVAALYAALGPLRHLGLDPERSVVRLLLVLRYVESLPRPRDWRTLLDAPLPATSEVVEVDAVPLAWADYALATGVAAALIVLIVRVS